MCAVQSARTFCNSAASLTPKARSMSDHRSSRASAAEPVIAAPLIRWSLAAYSRSSDRRRARSSGVNMSASNLLLRGVINSTVPQGLHDGGPSNHCLLKIAQPSLGFTLPGCCRIVGMRGPDNYQEQVYALLRIVTGFLF